MDKDNINEDKNEKYKKLFDKHKNEDEMLSHEEVHNILNECGKKTSLKESEELILKITKDNKTKSINFEGFVKLMDEDFEEEIEKKVEHKTLSTCQIYLFMLLLLITGSINTIANKMQQNTEALGTKYSGHQKFITFSMFNGELLCLLFYYIKEGRFKKKENALLDQKEKKQPKIWYFLFPAIFDIFGSSIGSISLTFLPSSIYQMFRGAIIIFTCTASIIFLKNKYYRHHFLGIGIVVIGLCIVGTNAIVNNNKQSESGSIGLGIFLIILSQLFSCFLFITEEKLLKGYGVPPLKAVGLEGMWGVGCYIILLFIFYFIRCEEWYDLLRDGICIKDESGDIRFENALFALRQIADSTRLKCFLSMYVLSIAFFNFSGLTISKNVSATARTIVDTLRTVVIWVFFLTMPFLPEDIQETFSWIQLFGFILLIIGGLIYNEILVIKYFKFGDYTKKAIKAREELEAKKKDEEEKGGEKKDEEEKEEKKDEEENEEKKKDEEQKDDKEEDE